MKAKYVSKAQWLGYMTAAILIASLEPSFAEPKKTATKKAAQRAANDTKSEAAVEGKAALTAQPTTLPASPDVLHSALAEDPSLTHEGDVFPVGYANRPAKPEEEKLSIFGRVMFRAMTGQQDSPYSHGNDFDNPDFNFRRLRLGAIYQGSKNWGALIHLRLENAMNVGPGVAPNRGLIQEANLWYQWDFMRTKITAGMINQPFAREYQVSSANLVNIERGMVNDALQQFDNGIQINFNPLREFDKKLDRYVTVYGMIGTGGGGGGDFNGGRRVDLYAPINLTSSGATTNNPNASTPISPFFYGRININPLGAMQRGNKEVGWVEGEEMFLTENKISFGAALAGTNETRITNSIRPEYQTRAPTVAPFSGAAIATNAFQFVPMPITLSSNTSGTNSVGQCAPGVQCSLLAQTYDVKGNLLGFYFDAQYSYFGGAAGQNVTGVTATIGRNFHISKGMWIMPLIRYDFMKGNFGNAMGHYNTSGLSSDPSNQITKLWAGLNFYIDKNLAKIQVAYAKTLNNYQGYDNGSNALAPYKQDMIIVNAVTSFWTGAQIADKPNADLSGRQP